MNIVQNMSNEDYHAHPAFSSSDIKTMKKSARHFKTFVLNKTRKEPTDAMELGTLAHAAILEGKFEFIKGPDVSRATKEWKSFVAENEGKTILKPEDYHMLHSMWNESQACELLQRSIQGAMIEASFFATIDGLEMKARPDAINEIGSGVLIIDYKTALSCDLRGFTKAILDRGYHISAIHYMTVCSKVMDRPITDFSFLWFAQEKTAPYIITIYDMDSDLFEYAWKEYGRLTNMIKTCIDSNKFPAYSDEDEVISVKLPGYLKNDYEQECGDEDEID